MDPYSVLGVKRNASKEEIDAAFKEQMLKYAEEKYADGPLCDLAAKKRSEIEAAYDEIIKERAAKKEEASENKGYSHTSDPKYSEIEANIASGNVMGALNLLSEFKERDAHWFYLNGQVALRRGMYNEAFASFKTAVNKNPSDPRYKEAYMRMQEQATSYRNVGGAGASTEQCCNCCSNLLIADCCCECLGGDLISCC